MPMVLRYAIIIFVRASSWAMSTSTFVSGTLDALVRADFENFRDLWFWWLLFSSAVVALGVTLEGPEVVHEFMSSIRGLPNGKTPPWIKFLGSIGWILIVLGLVGEGISENFVSKADGLVQTFNAIELAATERQLGEVNLTAAQANERAAQANKEAEDEKIARAKIEAAVAWRQLSEKDKHDIGSALTGFKSLAAASVWFNASSTEAEMFADDIAAALRIGDIVVQPPTGIVEIKGGGKFGGPINSPLTGVTVQSTNDEGARKFAALLIAELNRRGFDATRQTNPSFGNGKFPQIWVNVEPRPKGPQGEYKLRAEQVAEQKKDTNSKSSRRH